MFTIACMLLVVVMGTPALKSVPKVDYDKHYADDSFCFLSCPPRWAKEPLTEAVKDLNSRLVRIEMYLDYVARVQAPVDEKAYQEVFKRAWEGVPTSSRKQN